MTAPASIRAGDSATWEEDVPAYSSADGWQLSYRILSAGGAALESDATAGVSTTWSVALSAAATASLAIGSASLVAYVEKGLGPSLQRVTLYARALLVERDLVAAKHFDGRSGNQRALDDLRAALAAQAGKATVSEYEIAGRRMKFRTPQEILVLIRYYEQEVARERNSGLAAAGGVGSRILVRG